jgi:hypothetical protein
MPGINTLACSQGDQKNGEKFAQILEKVAQTVAKAKNDKIS